MISILFKKQIVVCAIALSLWTGFSLAGFSLAGFSLFKKTDNSTTKLPTSLAQKPLYFTTKEPEQIQKHLSSIAKTYAGSQAVQWWILYKKALLFKQTSLSLFCHNMQLLSQINDFPLKDYARLNWHSDCDQNATIDVSVFPEWLKKPALKAWHNKAKKMKAPADIMESAYQLYQIVDQKYQKEKYLLIALKQAKKTKDPRVPQWQKDLNSLSPRYITNPSHAQKLKVANDLRKARQFNKASLYYRQLLNHPKSSFKEKNESFRWMKWIYKRQRNHKKRLIATVQWKNWLKKQIKTNKNARGTYHDIVYLLARTQWTLNQSEKALKTLTELETALKSQFSLFKIHRMRALIFEEQKKLLKALTFFEKALKSPPPDTDMLEKTKWNYAWTLQKAGQKQKSIAILKELIETSKSDYLPSRARFWMAHIYEDINQTQKALSVYKELIKTDPLSYYGFLAHHKLNLPIRLNKKQDFLKSSDETEEYIVAKWLLSLNEKPFALDFLKYKSKQYEKDEDKKTKNWAGLFYYMAKAGSYFPLFKMAGLLPLKERTVFFKSYADLIFPILYEKEIATASQTFNIQKEVIYALIRQESAWNIRARSPAEAFGLMQLRPFVARRVAKNLKIPYKGAFSLYQPDTNILLGTAFLQKLFKQYDSNFIITIAVYNAGRTAVKRWLKTIPTENPLFFIEEIPYQETRTYVRLLIRNFIFYTLLLNPKREAHFPKWLISA